MACDDATNVTNTLISSVQGPMHVRTDAGEVTQRSSSDLIAAANYLRGLCASGNRNRGLRFNSLIPDGTVHARGRRFWNR